LAAPPRQATPVLADAADASAAVVTANTFVDIAATAKPGIVQVTNEQQDLQAGSATLVPAGVGTGFVIDAQGHILTNNHVVAQAQRLQVQTTDGKSFPAQLVGRDPRTDLAVIQVPGQSLPVVPLGDSGKLAVGQWVMAIGNALALEGGPTVTVGVVSALGRTVQEPGPQPGTSGPYLFDAIQTDAAINPGNSGGPLLNLGGEVVGINTLGAGMAEPGVQAQGISFAIAINTAKLIADQLITQGAVTYPYLGVATIANTPSLAARFGLPAQPGMVITAAEPGSPAAQAGLQPKDVIAAIDGVSLAEESTFSWILFTQHKPGETIALTVARGSQTTSIPVTLGTAPVPPA
jgi:S1-C subfamily serine protease